MSSRRLRVGEGANMRSIDSAQGGEGGRSRSGLTAPVQAVVQPSNGADDGRASVETGDEIHTLARFLRHCAATAGPSMIETPIAELITDLDRARDSFIAGGLEELRARADSGGRRRRAHPAPGPDARDGWADPGQLRSQLPPEAGALLLVYEQAVPAATKRWRAEYFASPNARIGPRRAAAFTVIFHWTGPGSRSITRLSSPRCSPRGCRDPEMTAFAGWALIRTAGLPIRLWLAAANPDLLTLEAPYRELSARLAAEIGSVLVTHPAVEPPARRLALACRRCLHRGDTVDPRQLTLLADTARAVGCGDLAEQLGEIGAFSSRLEAERARVGTAVESEQIRLLAGSSSPSSRGVTPTAGPLEPPTAARSRRHGGRRHNLSARLTSFVGRERELSDIQALLRTRRLVTLTGAGGVGKSRLALETAAESLLGYPGGTWLLELATLTQPGLLPQMLASALGVREHPQRPLIDVITEELGTTEALLVFDNCEHLLDEVAELAERVLGACPGARILATSRERLAITGEMLYPVAGLAVPQPGATDPDAVGQADAARLFVQRAADVQLGSHWMRRAQARWRRSASAWTACRWGSSWPPPE
jgi:hypothetical protein